MEIPPVQRKIQDLPIAATALPSPEIVSENREVIQAVKALNGAEILGQDNELTFQRDAQTGRLVIRVVNRETRDVVSQVPAEYVLRLAESLRVRSR